MTCAEGTALPLDHTLVERLDGDDAIVDGVPMDYFAVQAPSPGIMTVEMASARLDPFLVFWTDDTRAPAAQAFDIDGTGLVLRAHLEVPVYAGCHLVGATAWRAGEEGEYTLRAELHPGP
ncbi:MAG TPA: hypothetical protein VK966_03500 [Longimicrobiales bacterium]|nr:hypothetical protein [Longimicrobiales bacterium]